ncbi:PD-(D/E)XK nuclease family protein [Paenibacillus cremeus]|uniref:PD-(D/E)XK nuclease family protein n=1 Tax=Paenibacillus cremeus TaxID=2163881 RepID=UPI001C981609|nr:PD-(D/E)XK nuclease family protein [Paenibacillus cremeus]
MESWTLERVKLLLTQNELSYLTPAEARWIICRLLQLEASSNESYLHGITVSPGVTDVFHQAIVDLRSAGIAAEQLNIADFENEDKGHFVKKLLYRYEQELQRKQLVDLAGLLGWVKQLPSLGIDAVIVVNEEVIRTDLDQQLLIALTGGTYTTLAKEPVFTDPESEFPIEQTEIFHASGVLAEVREVFRRVSEMSIPWDQIELVLSNEEHYAGAVNTISSGAGICCTYAGGLSIGLTNAGKAAKLFLDWLESNYNVEHLLLALKQGYIRLKTKQNEADVTTFSLIRELERTGIGWGKERYRLLEKRIAEASDEETILKLRLLNSFVQHLFNLVTEKALSSVQGLIEALIEFTSTYAVLKDEEEHQVLSGIKVLQQSLAAAGELEMETALVFQYVREGLSQLRIRVSGTPSPGHIHVAPLAAGGLSGRPYTFILGMGEKNWKVSARQDPVLLDEERARIHPALITGIGRVGRTLEQRSRRLGMIHGTCFFSFCSYDPTEGYEQVSAYELLQVYRMKTGQPSTDFETMLKQLANGARYAGIGSRLAMDSADVWMSALLSSGSQIKDGSEAVYAHYLHISDGVIAAGARKGTSLSPYDGILDPSAYPVEKPEAGFNLAFSASKLEMYARCPLQYYYHDILGVRKNDTAVLDRSKWLNALQRGSLMHDIFNKYLTEMKEQRRSAAEPLTHDGSRLKELTEQVIQHFREQIPEPSEHIFRKECDSIRKDVSSFYVNEQRRSTIPAYMELQLHESEESPMLLELSDELTLPIRGFVDRVDAVRPHHYKIFDYKTGSPRRYKQNECFSGGKQLQLSLYGLAVEQWMRQTGFDPEAKVIESSYYFPTEKGMGEEVGRPQDRRKELTSLVVAMLDAMKQGLYPPTKDPKNCTWCDYKDVCDSHAEQFKAKREQPDNGERLARILEVERFD